MLGPLDPTLFVSASFRVRGVPYPSRLKKLERFVTKQHRARQIAHARNRSATESRVQLHFPRAASAQRPSLAFDPGFSGNSQIRIDGVPAPTTFVDIRTLKAKIPAAVVATALPNRFIEPGPEQLTGIYGDRTVKISVFNPLPDGGLSGSISVRVTAKVARR